NKNNLWVYDPNLRRLSIFSSPNFELKNSFNLEPYIYDFVVDSNGNIIAYTSSKDYLITIFDKEGNVITKKLKPVDKSFRIHSNRYNLGGVAKAKNPAGFYEVYPGQYVINFFNEDYKLTSAVKPLYENSSKYRPDPPPFPKNYDPYKAHLEYWNSFLHVHDVFSTSDMIILFLSENIPEDKYRFYINIYSKDGVIIAEGLHIPQNAMLIAAKGNKIFTWVRGNVNSNGKMRPQKLISYQLKKVN
ncbi:MAG TPA: hypothetical protein VK982_16350, partial [Bacteroidales bacterium]|nr:hypothetical protein [Bacteroidales bacterium]